jgi:hypothetical protein
MKILAFAKRNGKASVEEMQTYFQAEVQGLWDLYSQGFLREFYARADQPGAPILAVEAESVESARKALARLPLVERGLIDLDLIPLAPYTNLAMAFQVAEPAVPAQHR